MQTQFDVAIVGAGVIGCAVARALSQYQLDIVVLEKEGDVAFGTSGKNSGVVHAGLNNTPNSLMAELCVEGNLAFEALCKELDIPYKKTGKLVIAFDDDDLQSLDKLMQNGQKNAAPGLHLIGQDQIRALEPNVGGIAAMLSPNTAVTNPFLYTIALAENAKANGAQFYFNFKVNKIEQHNNRFVLTSHKRKISATYIINCAGVYSDRIAAMAGDDSYHIYPCRGQYYILDKNAGQYINMPVYPALKSGVGGLGVHLTPTIDGNVLIGPSAEYITSRRDYSTTADVMQKLWREAKELLPPISQSDIITSFSGIRSKIIKKGEANFGDFIIEHSGKADRLINLVGIESPGLTASYPIAKRVVELLCQKEMLKRKQSFVPQRKGIAKFSTKTLEEKRALIAKDACYGEIICRCEQITRREILDAIHNPLGTASVIGIKNRVRATMGRCQGGYCLTRIAEILAQELGIDACDVPLKNQQALFMGHVK